MRRLSIAILAAGTFVVAGVLSGDGLARASYMADPDHAPRTARKVHVTLDRDEPRTPPLVRINLDDPQLADATPLPLTSQLPQRPVRVELEETTEGPPPPVAVLPPPSRRVVRLTIDGIAPGDLAPRVFHADLDAAETFTASTPNGAPGPVRVVRSDL